MKRLANVVSAPGAGTKQNSFTLNSLFFPLKITLFALIATISASSLRAQHGTQNIDTITFGVTVPEGLYLSGDIVEVDIHIGSPTDPIKDLLGFDLWLDLGGVARPATNHPSMDFEGSCLIKSSAFDSSSTWNPGTDLYSFEAILGTGAAGTGTGHVVSVWLEITADNVDASSVIANAGGLALIENISGKQAAPTASIAASTVAYPNPATHTLYFDPSTQSSTAQLYAMDGRLLTEITLPAMGRTQVDVSNFPRGMSLLVFEDGSRRRIVLK